MGPRQRMLNALTDWVIPFLKRMGFQGDFPTYRRIVDGAGQLVTFQFSGFDEAFCLCVARCPSEGLSFSTGEYLPSNRLSALHCSEKLYLGAQGDCLYHWFKFNCRKHELQHAQSCKFMTMYSDAPLKYKYICDDVIGLIKNQAKLYLDTVGDWWKKGKLKPYNGLFFEFQEAFSQNKQRV